MIDNHWFLVKGNILAVRVVGAGQFQLLNIMVSEVKAVKYIFVGE